MSVLDFLFEGQPPPSVSTYGQSVESMPQWMSDYTQGLISRANTIAGEPYQTYGGPRLAGLTPEQMAAYGMIPGVVQQGQTMGARAAQMPGALTTASPYLAGASRTFPGAVDEYMNPYVDNVINRARTLTNRALTEDFMPAVERKFGAAGHDTRSSAYRREVDRGVRDLTEGLHEQSQAALADAYGQAGQLFGQDANRLGALAQTAGDIASDDRLIESGLAETLQNLGVQGAAALESAGAAQQGQTQRSLDLAYQDFMNQRDYPRQTVDWMSSVLQGVPYNRGETSVNTGPADSYQPSGAAQLGSLISSGLGAWDAWRNRNKARGGRVRYNRGGALRYVHG